MLVVTESVINTNKLKFHLCFFYTQRVPEKASAPGTKSEESNVEAKKTRRKSKLDTISEERKAFQVELCLPFGISNN